MVFGPVLDALTARQRGVSTLRILSEGNRQVTLRLSLTHKVIFWLTNAPYWALAAELWCGDAPHVAGDRAVHACAMCIVAGVSTAFHGSVLFGPADSIWPARLLSADILCANCYGVFLASLCGWLVALRYFPLPLILLAVAAKSKRVGRIGLYAWGHGLWHVLSAAAMWRCLYHDRYLL